MIAVANVKARAGLPVLAAGDGRGEATLRALLRYWHLIPSSTAKLLIGEMVAGCSGPLQEPKRRLVGLFSECVCAVLRTAAASRCYCSHAKGSGNHRGALLQLPGAAAPVCRQPAAGSARLNSIKQAPKCGSGCVPLAQSHEVHHVQLKSPYQAYVSLCRPCVVRHNWPCSAGVGMAQYQSAVAG